MNIQSAVTVMASKKGWDVAVDNKGDGTMEIVAFAKSDPDFTEFFFGKIQEASAWVRNLDNVTEAPKVEQVADDDAWEAEFGGMTDEDVKKALAPTQEEPTEKLESPQIVEDSKVQETENIQEANEETVEDNNIVKKFKGLFKKHEAREVDMELPSIVNETVIDEEFSYLDVDEVRSVAEAARKGCYMTSLGYISRGGKATTRPVRIANVVDDRFYAWDLQEYTSALSTLRAEAPAGRADIVNKRQALIQAQREFLLRRVTDISLTDEKMAPINPGGAVVVRPATKSAVSTRGNGFPRQVGPQAVENLLQLGFVLVPAGE